MQDEKVQYWLNLIQSGDNLAREKLIDHYRAFILKEAQRVCRRSLEWGRDDELSIALMAFNEAVDAYRKRAGSSFDNLCRLVIKRRLIDYFRQAGKIIELPGDDKVISGVIFNEDWDRSEREEEIVKYGQLLKEFKLDFSQIAASQPKHSKTRKKLRRAAKKLAADQELMNYLFRNGKLPQSRLCEITGLSPRVLDRGRKYIIALALLLCRGDLPHLQNYARELANEGDVQDG